MRIALTLEKLDLKRGGAEVATHRLIQELAARGHQVEILTTESAIDLPSGCRIRPIRVPWRFVAFRQLSFARQIERHLRSESYDLSLAAAGRGSCEDALWAQNGTHRGASAGKERGYYFSPVVRRLRRFQDYYNIRTYVYRHLERRFFARHPPPFVIAPSRMIAGQFYEDYHLPPDRVRVVAYQVDLARFSPERMRALRAEARAAVGLTGDPVAILCVAQNFRRKGVRPLIEAAARLRSSPPSPDFVILVVGSNEHEQTPYLELAKRLDVTRHLRFLGQRRNMEEVYAAADVFCLPTFADPCAIATIEAMACGLPVITSRYNGAHELIDHGTTGLIVNEPADIAELAGAIQRTFVPATRDGLGAAAATIARRLCNDPNSQIARIIEDLAEHKKRDARQRAMKSG